MKLFLGYPVFSKVDMVEWLVDGIAENFRPWQTQVRFLFVNCEDGSVAAFHDCLHKLKGWDGDWDIADHPGLHELGAHNLLLDSFLDSDCDLALIAQDDQRFNRPVHAHIEAALEKYGPRLGVVGGRDGYFAGHGQMACSAWSESTLCQQRLKPGETVERPFLNSGPVGYPRRLVETIGLLDEEFVHWYVWDDYGVRARAAGFTSIILGMDVTHRKFGRLVANPLGVDGTRIAAADLVRLRRKHGHATVI